MALTTLKVRGPFKGPSGYDHHVREFVRELVRQGVAVELIDLPAWGPAKLPEHLQDPWFETLRRRTGATVTLHFCMPHQVQSVGTSVDVNYTMFEATRICSEWAAASRARDLVIVPTESSRRAWIAAGVPEQLVRLCPLGINPASFGQSPEPFPLKTSAGAPIAHYRARFLNVSEVSPRKNLVGLIRSWLKATRSSDDAVLILKLGTNTPRALDHLSSQLSRLQDATQKRFSDAAPIHFVHDLFADHEMPRLYATATHYLSLSHGEGWDQPMLEAAASGLRLIAPAYSAYATYLTPSIATLIPGTEIPAAFPGDPSTAALFDGACWWEPDEEQAIAAIRSAIDGRDTTVASPREPILQEYTWKRATRRLIELLDEVEARRTQRSFWPALPRREGDRPLTPR
jgi:glycosyltransferase involved in cell wall biosynthesis